MANKVISSLAKHGIYNYGSAELLQQEKHLARYFEREYRRWEGNATPPEHYGTSSFEGNIAARDTCTKSIEHYNKELKIYEAFLDHSHMCYTMGYYGADNNTPAFMETTLAQAQTNKFDLVIKRAGISEGQNILEIGCGFGGFSAYLLNKFPDISITAINPSTTQSRHLKSLMEEGSSLLGSGRFRLVESYLDDLTDTELKSSHFDSVVSIGVLEAVSNIDRLFQLIARILKPGGKSFHHFIVSVDTIPTFLNAENTLMADYFPGGHIWPYAELSRHNSHLDFTRSWFINGMNYWKTLDEWHKRFWLSIDELFPDYLSMKEVESWNNYFMLCKTMFNPNNGKSYGVGHYLHQKN